MFQNREEAGRLLAEKLSDYKNRSDATVIGIPRGGVVVAKKVADILILPLNIVVVRKIGAAENPELAIGAVGPKNTVYWDRGLCQRLGISKSQISKLKSQKERERRQRELKLGVNRKSLALVSKTVILVDDGVATGATVVCAAKFLRKVKTRKIILAIPVVSRDTLKSIAQYFDELVVLSVEESFYAVGQFYREFPQVSDEEVIQLLEARA